MSVDTYKLRIQAMKLTMMTTLLVLGLLVVGSNHVEAGSEKHWRHGHWERGSDRHWHGGHRVSRPGHRSWRPGRWTRHYAYHPFPRVHWHRSGWRRGRNHWVYGTGAFATGLVLGAHMDQYNACPPAVTDGYHPSESITGCYRIETLPDGGERRVELPLSDCR